MIAVATGWMFLSAENTLSGWSADDCVTNSAPANDAMPPDTANATSFMRLGDTVLAAAASSLSRTAIIERPIPLRRTRAITTVMTAMIARQMK
jgi:hypothetical protein